VHQSDAPGPTSSHTLLALRPSSRSSALSEEGGTSSAVVMLGLDEEGTPPPPKNARMSFCAGSWAALPIPPACRLTLSKCLCSFSFVTRTLSAGGSARSATSTVTRVHAVFKRPVQRLLADPPLTESSLTSAATSSLIASPWLTTAICASSDVDAGSKTYGRMIARTARSARACKSAKLSPSGNFSVRPWRMGNTPRSKSGFAFPALQALPSAMPKCCSRRSGEMESGGLGSACASRMASAVEWARLSGEAWMAVKRVSVEAK